jgi:hypothetical protein
MPAADIISFHLREATCEPTGMTATIACHMQMWWRLVDFSSDPSTARSKQRWDSFG